MSGTSSRSACSSWLLVAHSYILGRDPKPPPPPMKITKDMVEAMGGQQSEEMRRFRSHCFSAFLILRKNVNLILNLFALMVDSNVQVGTRTTAASVSGPIE